MTSSLLSTASVDSGAMLQVEASDINFFNSAPDRVNLEITLWNAGAGFSRPTQAFVMAAPLGAFVPWRPLAFLPLPALAPGQSYTLQTEVVRAASAPLGPPDRVPPQRLLTALGSEDDRTPQAGSPLAWWPRRSLQSLLGRPRGATNLGLPGDLFELMGRSNPHFAGNFNVFVGGKAVERHLAQAIRIYPGRMNMAMFVVGARGQDSYAFQLDGDGADWDARLYDMTDRSTLALAVSRADALAEKEWIKVVHTRIMMLAINPPQGCGRGKVDVSVEQRSTGKTAVVEFSLDPAAAGPGCFVV
ncbi:MAG TPA: hypothetical protein VGG61_16310 [Gemmataceae bacterium]